MKVLPRILGITSFLTPMLMTSLYRFDSSGYETYYVPNIRKIRRDRHRQQRSSGRRPNKQ